MKKRKIFLIGVLIIVFLCLVLLGTFLLIRLFNNGKALPLIQIHQPFNHEQLPYGKGIIIHATADAKDGMERMELWVDNQLISFKEADQDEPIPKLVISAGWVPYPIGDHGIIVRATSKNGGVSQASIHVEAIEFAAQPSTIYIVQEEDTIESIAEAFDIPEEEILGANKGLDSGVSLDPGGELTLPPEEPDIPSPFGAGPGSSESESPPDLIEPDPGAEDELPEPETEDEAPEPSTEVDPLWLGILELFFNIEIPTQLQIEVLSLETEGPYNSLHCYASLADADPQWVPDADFNQATDESFFSISGDGRTWDVAEHFAQENAMDLAWVMSEPVPLDISCVGVVAGGMESIELGRVVDEIEPHQWGITQAAYSSGGESSFYLTYKVSHPAKGLDTSIEPPFNVRISEEDHKLFWDYDSEEIENIDGFAVLINDTLQWTVHQSIQETDLPPEWFTLPCGDEYRFTVVAYRFGYPDGDYSNPSEPAVISGNEVGSEGCNRTVLITFETLTTGALGRNPSPVYGSFFANDQVLSFDGRPIDGDNFPTTFGLRQNDRVAISRIMYGFGNDQTQLVVEIPPGRPHIEEYPLWLGFDIYQAGTRVCTGDVAIPENHFAGTYSGTITTDDPPGSLPDWCIVNYTMDPIGETPVVEPGAPPPLPNLVVQEITADPSTGRPRIHIRNLGLSSWVNQDLVVQVTSTDGEQIGLFEFHNLTIGPGEVRILSHGALYPDTPLGICVLLDPDNDVEEEIDRLIAEGMYSERQPYCKPLPDLTIEEVSFDSEYSQLHIDIKNQGERPSLSSDIGGSLDHSNLMVWLTFEDGRPLTQDYTELDMDFNETKTLIWPLGEIERERMRDGYTVLINPAHSIAESDFSNNEYHVEGISKLLIEWKVGWASFCETGTTLWYGENTGGKNTWEFHLTANVVGANERWRVAGWDSSEIELTWRDGNTGDSWCRTYLSDWFEVAGDEKLIVSPWVGLDIASHGYRWFSGGSETLTAADDFGGTIHFPLGTEESCLDQPASYPYICRGMSFCTGGCGIMNCTWLGEAGEHIIGPIVARSDDITNTCYWSTTYIIFKEVED